MPRVDAWERNAEWPMAGIAVAFLGAWAWPILDPDLPSGAAEVCRVITVAAWVLFAVDYLARLSLADQRLRFVRHNLVDLLVIALPALRPLRLLRLVALLRILNRSAASKLRGRVTVYAAGATLLGVFVGGLAVLDAESSNPDANIQNAPDAWWWAVTTITTVGYGDHFPTTHRGRLVAILLMLCGIALVGLVTATLASWLIERIQSEETKTRDDVAILTEEVRELRQELRRALARADATGR